MASFAMAAPTQQPGITGSRTYNGQTAILQASVPGMPGLPPGVLEALQEKQRIAAQEAAMRLKMQQAQLRAMQSGERQQRMAQNQPNEGSPGLNAGLTPGQVEDREWQAARNGALTPVHGFNMTGDYTIDPNKLPPRFRAQSAGFAAPQSAGLGASAAGLGASPASNQPAAGGFTAGQEYEGKGGVGGGPVAALAPNERPDWYGTGSTDPAVQGAVLQNNARNRQAQQDAMMKNATQALLAGMGGYRGNQITPIGVR